MRAPEAGSTIVITGASSGIGKAAAAALAGAGAMVAVVGRNPERTAAVADSVGGVPFVADFDHLDQVRGLAEALLARFETIDVLANNAGGIVTSRQRTADGHDRTFQSNHLAPFLLTRLLLPRLTESGGRVISTASNTNLIARLRLDDLDYDRGPWLGGWRAYGTSKLATILFIRELARRTAGTGVDAYASHPGYVASSFGNEIGLLRFAQLVGRGRLGYSNEDGAGPMIFLASTPEPGAPSGTYFSRLDADGMQSRRAFDQRLATDLWAKSSELVGLSAD
jgi:NAD(P)-dependent dehydrogenase (short-subunit alcohol dehydrogenase family)